MLAAGFVIALITPDASILGVGVDTSIVTEAFRQAVGTQLTAMVDPGLLIPGSRRIHPMLLLAIPLGGADPHHPLAALPHRGRAGARPVRLGALVAIPFGLLMLVFAVLGGSTETTQISPSVGSAFALGMLWGVVGGLIGAATKLPLGESLERVPPRPRTVFRRPSPRCARWRWCS